MVNRICVYIDGANFFGGLNILNKKFTDWCFDFERYVNGLIGNDFLVCVYYYNGYVKKKINLEIWKKQLMFFKNLQNLKNWKVVLCRKQECRSEEGKIYFKLKEDDINLAISALSGAYENNYDKLILISSDRDFISLIRQIKKIGKKVEICYFENCISEKLLKLFKEENRKKITKNIVKKYFKPLK